MSSQRDLSVLTGAVVAEGSNLEPQLFRQCLIPFYYSAWPFEAFPVVMNTVIVMAEDTAHTEPVVDEVGRIQWISMDFLENGIHNAATLKAKDLPAYMPRGHTVLLAVGRREFCLAFVHFWSHKGNASVHDWGAHLFRRVALGETGSVHWYDHANTRVHSKDLRVMHEELALRLKSG